MSVAVHGQQVAGLEVLSARGAGAGDRPPLLFVHGAFSAAWVFAEHFLPWFAGRGFDAHALSLRGHGASPAQGPLDAVGLDDYVDDVSTVLAWLGGRVVLMGHSLGGMLVQRVLTTCTLPAAVLMCSVPPLGLATPALTMALRHPRLYRALQGELWHDGVGGDGAAVRRALFSSALPEAAALDYMGRMGPESRRVMTDLVSPVLALGWALPGTPVMVLGACQDPFVSETMVAVTARRFGTRPHLQADVGHALMLDVGWERVAIEVAAWLATTLALPGLRGA